MIRQLRALTLRAAASIRGGARERDLAQELESHLQMQIDDNIRSGMTPDEARRQALVRFGGVEAVKESCRDRQRLPPIETVAADLRFAGRMMRKNPAFTALALLSLAAGIGATTAVFSVVNAVVLRPLPVPDAFALHVVRLESPLPTAQRFSHPMFDELRRAPGAPPAIAALSRVARMRTRIGRDELELASVQLVSGEFFRVMAIPAALGRVFTDEDNLRQGQHPIGVISRPYWRRRFAEAADVVGRTVVLNGTAVTIIGVAAGDFTGVWLESPVDVWVPAAMQAEVRYAQNFTADNAQMDKPWFGQDGIRWLDLVLRAERRDGSEIAALNARFLQLLTAAAAARTGDPETRRLFLQQRLVLEPFAQGSSTLRERFLPPLLALMAMVLLLLLIACANTANLLLARAAARRREMAVRLSMGASRRRVIQQLLTESLLLGGIGGLAGLALAPQVSSVLVRTTLSGSPGPMPFSVAVDARVLIFAVVVSLLTSLLFGAAPAWRTTEFEVAAALKSGGSRGVHEGSRLTLAKTLVVAQVALSLLLVVAAALFGQSFRNLVQLDLGFERQHLVSIRLDLRNVPYKGEDMPALQTRLVDGLQRVPGVRSAAFAMCGLMAGCRSAVDGLHITGYKAQPTEQVILQENRVGPDYFSTVGIRLVSGRVPDQRDTAASPRVAVVNEAAVRRYFRNRPAIGERFGYDAPDIEIVGIVGDARVNSSREAAAPMTFYPLAQGPPLASAIEVRVAGDPETMVPALRKKLMELEPSIPIEAVVPTAAQASRGLSQDRLVAGVTSSVGAMALGLACLGLYGLMSYAVKRRTGELGIRMALGATQRGLIRMVLGESLLLVSLGLIVGVPAVIAASQLVSKLLFDVKTNDPATITACALTLAAVATVSAYVPAWRASRVDPVTALRTE